MGFLSRKTKFWNRTGRHISVRPVRSSVEYEIEDPEIIIAAGGLWKVKSTEFSYEETIPNFHGILRIKFVGESDRNAIIITAHHVRVCAEIFFREDNNDRLIITGITETLWDYIPFGQKRNSNHERNEQPIYEQINLDGTTESAMVNSELA